MKKVSDTCDSWTSTRGWKGATPKQRTLPGWCRVLFCHLQFQAGVDVNGSARQRGLIAMLKTLGQFLDQTCKSTSVSFFTNSFKSIILLRWSSRPQFWCLEKTQDSLFAPGSLLHSPLPHTHINSLKNKKNFSCSILITAQKNSHNTSHDSNCAWFHPTRNTVILHHHTKNENWQQIVSELIPVRRYRDQMSYLQKRTYIYIYIAPPRPPPTPIFLPRWCT